MRTWIRYSAAPTRCPLCRAAIVPDECAAEAQAAGVDDSLVHVATLCRMFVTMYVLFLAVLYPINYFAMYHACQSFGRLHEQVVCYVRI